MAGGRNWDRRSLLRGAAVVAGAAATTPLLGKATRAHADGGDADALFRAGKFEEAARAYEEILKKDPTSLHAARQRGYVGLLANRFPDAEKYLTMALRLAPDDKETNQLLVLQPHLVIDEAALSLVVAAAGRVPGGGVASVTSGFGVGVGAGAGGSR